MLLIDVVTKRRDSGAIDAIAYKERNSELLGPNISIQVERIKRRSLVSALIRAILHQESVVGR